MESQRKGDLTEATVVTELLRREVPVSMPFGDNERYDLVVESPDGRMLRAQVKTGWTRDSAVLFKGYNQHTNSSGNTYKPYTDTIDSFLVYSHDYGRLFLIWVDEVWATMAIRIEESDQRHESTNWADEYAFDERWPPTRSEYRLADADRGPTVRPVVETLRVREVPFVRVQGAEYHLVARDAEGIRHRLRACTGTVTDGRIRFDATTGNADAYGLHCPQTDTVYLVPDDAFDRSISLRVEESNQADASINWAEDYTFEEQWPP